MQKCITLTAVVLMVMLATSNEGRAQAVTIQTSNYVPPAMGGPRANPQGTYIVNAAGIWKVSIDYGSVVNGAAFVADPNIGASWEEGLPNARVGVQGTWGPRILGPQPLLNPLPANTYVRAQLQKKDAQGNFQPQGSPALYAIP